jgi:CRP-like cAMP-binding protein
MVQNKYYLFRLVNVLKQGDFFGEVAIQNRIPRTGTVLSKTKVLVAVLTFETY